MKYWSRRGLIKLVCGPGERPEWRWGSKRKSWRERLSGCGRVRTAWAADGAALSCTLPVWQVASNMIFTPSEENILPDPRLFIYLVFFSNSDYSFFFILMRILWSAWICRSVEKCTTVNLTQDSFIDGSAFFCGLFCIFTFILHAGNSMRQLICVYKNYFRYYFWKVQFWSFLTNYYYRPPLRSPKSCKMMLLLTIRGNRWLMKILIITRTVKRTNWKPACASPSRLNRRIHYPIQWAVRWHK